MIADLVPLVALVVLLAVAYAHPRGRVEVAVGLVAAGATLATGELDRHDVADELRRLGPVVGFLVAILVVAECCRAAGVFSALGARLGRVRSRHRLLVLVFVVAVVVTAVLSLDATVVLLTPVVFATAARAGVRPKPYVYACTHLANSASLLLPVSNLTNLLAFTASGLSFARFTALMALPWVAVVAIEYVVLRRFFGAELAVGSGPRPARPDDPVVSTVTVVVVVATLVGFVVAAVLGVPPAWAAAGGALVLGARALARRRTDPATLLRAANLPFCLFVLALGIIIVGVVTSGLGDVVAGFLPAGSSFLALLAIAGVAAVLANLLNNLPAVLLLVPLAAAAGGPSAVLAALLGVNLGPNLTYVGSLATLLWRRVLREHDAEPAIGEFTRLGAWSVPATLLGGVGALWLSLVTIGGVG